MSNTINYLERRFPKAPALKNVDIKMIKGLEKRYVINNKSVINIEELIEDEEEIDEEDLLNENDFDVEDKYNARLFYVMKYKNEEFINVLVEYI